jgi:hypothetical protein
MTGSKEGSIPECGSDLRVFEFRGGVTKSGSLVKNLMDIFDELAGKQGFEP